MEENPIVSMGRAIRITRKSIHKFLQHYEFLTSIAGCIALPFAISVLLSQAIIPRSFDLLPTVYGRLHALFDAAGFPPWSEFFTLLSLKLSQTISTSIITFPFSLSFLLLAKASIIHFLFTNKKQSTTSFVTLYNPILCTHLCSSFVIFAANATCFALLFLAFNFLESFNLDSPRWVILFSTVGAVFYSVILANALVICNLALVSSGVQKEGGLLSILKACIMIRGKTSTALALAVPINIGLAAVEALFHFRIIAASAGGNTAVSLLALEGLLIAYIYSMLLVLDVIISCIFYQCCEFDHGFLHQITQSYVGNYHDGDEIEVQEDCYYEYNVEKLKGLEEFV